MKRSNSKNSPNNSNDTSRTSNQGRKTASGGRIRKGEKGSPEKDENSKAEISEQHTRENPKPRRS